MKTTLTRAKAGVAALALTAGAVALSAGPAAAMSYVSCSTPGSIEVYLWDSSSHVTGYRCYSGSGDDVYSGVYEFGAIATGAWTGHVWWNGNNSNYEWATTNTTYTFST